MGCPGKCFSCVFLVTAATFARVIHVHDPLILWLRFWTEDLAAAVRVRSVVYVAPGG